MVFRASPAGRVVGDTAAVEPASGASEQGVGWRSFGVVVAPQSQDGGGAYAAENSGAARESERENDAPDRYKPGGCSLRSVAAVPAAAVAAGYGTESAVGKAAERDAVVVAGEPQAGIGSTVAAVRTELGSAHHSCCASAGVVARVNVVLADDAVVAAAGDVAADDSNGLWAVVRAALVEQSIPEQVAKPVADTGVVPVAEEVDGAAVAAAAAAVGVREAAVVAVVVDMACADTD